MKTMQYDLTVIGAGVAGITAALAAARNGLKVALVNDRSVLGGNGSSEIGVPISGSCHFNHNAAIYAKEGGIVEEIRLRKSRYLGEGGWFSESCWDAVYFDLVYSEPNITLYLNTLATDVETKDGKITAVTALHLTNEETYRFESDYYVDSTGNGVVAARAGAEFRHGREGKSEHNEKWAPEVGDSKTMGNTFIFEVREADHPVKFTAPSFALDISKMEFMQWIDKKENFRRIGPHGFDWTFEYGGQKNIIKDSEDIDRELRALTFGIWNYVKNSGKYPDAENMVLVAIKTKSGSRESRRILGDYILTENDIEQKVNFPDSVAIGGWPMDVHAPLGIYDPAPASNFIPVTGIYNIPLRCLYSKDVSNLFMAGRDASFTHIALGSTRVIATCACMGQAVGTAAVICKKYGVTPRTAAAEHIEEIQRLLMWDDQTILHRKDSVLSGFTATADSTMVYENTKVDEEMPLERAYGLALMLESERLESLKVKMRVSRPTVLTLNVLTGIHPETYLPSQMQKQIQIPLEPTDGWVTLPTSATRGADGKVYLVFEQNPDITLYTAKARTLGAVTHRYHTETSHDHMDHDTIPLPMRVGEYIGIDRTYEEQKNILFCDLLPTQNVFSADKAINGYSRPYGMQNLWQPERGNLPATLTLTADQPTDVHDLAIVFNTRLELDAQNALPYCHVKSYRVTIETADGKVTEFEETDNRLRQAMLHPNLSGVTRISITILETYGGVPGIFAVKVR